MDIQSARLINAAANTALKPLLQNLQVGQQLYAKVLEKLPEKNDVLLQIGQQTLRARSDIPLDIQQSLRLQVIQTRDEIVLRILDPAPQTVNASSQALRRLLPIQQPLADLLPRLADARESLTTGQKTPDRVLNQIQQLTERLIQTTPTREQLSTANGVRSAFQQSGLFLETAIAQNRLHSIPVQVRNEIDAPVAARLIPKLPTTSAGIQGEAPRNAPAQSPGTSPGSVAPTAQPILQSPASATAATPVHSEPLARVDTKANLVRLIALIRSWPGIANQPTASAPTAPTTQAQQQAAPVPTPTLPPPSQPPAGNQPAIVQQQMRNLLNQAEASVAKLTIHQLASSSGDEVTRPQWQTEIPILHHGPHQQSVAIRIEADQEPNIRTSASSPWRVTLELNPPHLGLIRCQIQLQAQQISTDFWAESAATAQLIRENLSAFREQLHSAQFETQTIRCSHGPDSEIKLGPAAQSVLNERA